MFGEYVPPSVLGSGSRYSSLRYKPKGAALPLIVAFTIRSDRYAPLQTAKQLTRLKTVLFDSLQPIPQTQFRETIIRPVERHQ